MLITGETAYADTHFHLDDGQVINSFTGKDLGKCLRTIPSTNYIFIQEEKKVGSIFDTMNQFKRELEDEEDRTI